jgi:N-acetylneuraminic acid mutarotase
MQIAKHFSLCYAATLLVLGCAREDTPTGPGRGEEIAAPSLAIAANTWITRADMSPERSGSATASVTNAAGQSIIYVIGGASINGGSLSRVQAYNVATNTWTYRASLPVPLFSTNGAGVIGGKIYVSGGRTNAVSYQNGLYMYDPARNTWTQKHSMPLQTAGGLTGVINNKLYVLASCHDPEHCDEFIGAALYRYDPATNLWTQLGTPARSHSYGVAGGLESRGSIVWTREQDVYDPATNTWTPKAPLPRKRYLGAGTAMEGKLYVIGGWEVNPDGSTTTVKTTSVYDPATNTWTTKAALPTARRDIAATRVFLNGQPRIEMIGGSRPGNNLAYIP